MVYKVINKKTQKPYVMKIIIIKNDEKRNYNEFNILNKLKNDNIIRFYGMNEIKKNEVDFVIMEYGKFGNIKSFMKNILKHNYLSESLLCFFSYQILNGLKYCHINKICHFDIKPYNIIIDDYLKAKIIDFSIAIDYSEINTKTIKLPFKGTNFYMAPEVMESKTINKKDLNKIDLYSLGVTLYNLAFGTYPFGLNIEDIKDYGKIYYKIKNNKLEFDNRRNKFSIVFIDFLKKLLEKEIDKRININEALNHDWIKGANILIEEKEKICNISNFLIGVAIGGVLNFNEYLKNAAKKIVK
jgi:serine/threonine protein kinase